MKRSEMIEVMTQNYHHSQCGDLSEMTDYERMEYILNALEQFGMLPPYNTQYQDHGSVMDCQWSPEIEMTDEEFKKITSS